jgi:hypothetical protein
MKNKKLLKRIISEISNAHKIALLEDRIQHLEDRVAQLERRTFFSHTYGTYTATAPPAPYEINVNLAQ